MWVVESSMFSVWEVLLVNTLASGSVSDTVCYQTDRFQQNQLTDEQKEMFQFSSETSFSCVELAICERLQRFNYNMTRQICLKQVIIHG